MAGTAVFILDGQRRNIKMAFWEKGLLERCGVIKFLKWIIKYL